LTKHKHEFHPQNLGLEATEFRAPYWRRAHRDWRFWVVMVLMLTAIMTYVFTLDLSWRPRTRPLPLMVIGSK
jgi:hypothetical protein